MREWVTEAIVVDKEPIGEADARVALYTERFGMVVARATSARKITSKLAAHLEPARRVAVRLVERRNSGNSGFAFHVTDAITVSRLPLTRNHLRLLRMLAPRGEADPGLFGLVMSGTVSVYSLIAAFGFDYRFASCETCGKRPVERFSMDGGFFLCAVCAEGAASGSFITLAKQV